MDGLQRTLFQPPDSRITCACSCVTEHYNAVTQPASGIKAFVGATTIPPSGTKLQGLIATHLTYTVTVDNALLWSIDKGRIRSQGKVGRR